MKEWWRQELLWSVRWLAADPEAALAAAPGVVTTDEIALDLDHWSMMARDWALLDGPSLALLDEIDREFASMSDADRPELWEDVALSTTPEWLAQRARARALLDLMGEQRADARLGDPRPGGPVYAFQGQRRSR